MRSKYILIILILAGLLCLTCDDNPVDDDTELFHVWGKVYQEIGERTVPVANAQVIFNSYRTTTDSTGSYSIYVPEGSYQPICIHPLGDTLENEIIEIENKKWINLFVAGPTFKVSGIVSHVTDGVLEGVQINYYNMETYTDSNGYYELNDLPYGENTLIFSKEPYHSNTSTLIFNSTDLVKNILMDRDNYTLTGTVYHTIDGPIEGAEIILNEKFYDTTDIDGKFLFNNLIGGNYSYMCSHPNYNSCNGELTVEQLITDISIDISKAVIDTMWIELDAHIASSTGTDAATTNFGDESFLNMNNGCWEYIEYDSMGYIIRTTECWQNDILMRLPDFSSYEIDSAFFIIRRTPDVGWLSVHDYLKVHPLTRSWDESSVTWLNSPNVDYNGEVVIIPEYDIERRLKIDVTNAEHILRNYFGFHINVNKQWNTSSDIRSQFYSSEAANRSDRPYVVVYHTTH